MAEQESNEERIRLGLLLKDHREKLQKTQEEIAFAIGCGITTYSGWETGRYSPKAEDVVKLCNVFECSADELLGRTTYTSVYRYYDISGATQWIALDVAKIAPSMMDSARLGLRVFEALVIEGVTQSQLLHMKEFQGYTITDLFHAYRILVQFGVLRLVNVPRDEGYEKRLTKKYSHLKYVLVAKSPTPIDAPIIQTDLVAFLAAREAVETVHRLGNVGIGAGYTMLRMAELSLPDLKRFTGIRWIPLISFRDDPLLKYSANYIAARFQQLHIGSQNTYLPFDEHSLLDIHPIHFSLLSDATLFLSVSGRERVSLTGATDDVSQFQAADDTMAVPTILQQYQSIIAAGKKAEVSGEILGRIVDKQGDEFPFVRPGVSGLHLTHLKQIAATQVVFCVAAKAYKGQVVKTAIEKGIVNSLVIDKEIAEYLLR